MNIKFLNNTTEIREAFINCFVMSWDEFQVKQKDWIAKMAETNHPITVDWYEKAYMWDKMNPDFAGASMDTAIAFLKEHSGPVCFMAERGEDTYYQGKKIVDFIGEADAHALAARIEKEWYDSYRLTAQNMYDPDAFLPDDLYVFDATMKWCVVFTHETADWGSEIENPMKAARTRYCIICKV